MQGVGQRLATLEAVRLPALEAKVADTSTADLLESLRSCALSPPRSLAHPCASFLHGVEASTAQVSLQQTLLSDRLLWRPSIGSACLVRAGPSCRPCVALARAA